ncbi:MAG TPA: HAD family phosphatase [Polaromonas sp.]|uniref:HAD family hydrolase n=1 Tax=Polaromonas sp. TaxID=1869339 RepID=UPI002D5DBC9D|nr:HAD family phosphatase [Polaromonas sp.]HYW56088.1 HAD family phosphatase [Polaromonas sp.]
MNIVFDFGAILFAWQPAQLLRRHFPEFTETPDQAQQFAREVFHHNDWQDFDRGVVELDAVVHKTAARLSLPSDALHGLMAPIGEELAPIVCNVNLLSRLRGQRDQGADLQLYFLSNMPAPFARSLERKHAFLKWFDGGIFSGDVKLAKPGAAIYELLAERHGLEPVRTLFIDDALVNVDAARALGWHAIHCVEPEQLADQLYGTLNQLNPVLASAIA